MLYTILPFDISFLDQLDKLPPKEWQTNAYELFLHNENQPWFFPYQVVSNNELLGFGMFFHFEEFAWLGWILVHHTFRKKGIGTAITKHLLEEAAKKGVKGCILTATELGLPVYERLGFKLDLEYRFFYLPERYHIEYENHSIRNARWDDITTIIELDYRATGEKRRTFIEYRINECIVFEDETIKGFYLPGLGNGFIVASEEKAGIELMNYRCSHNKKVIVVPEHNKCAVQYLQQHSFIEGYKIPRMSIGIVPNWQPTMIYNRGSGYCG